MNEEAPTMSAGTGGFSGSANAKGPVAGFDPVMKFRKKFKKKKEHLAKANNEKQPQFMLNNTHTIRHFCEPCFFF